MPRSRPETLHSGRHLLLQIRDGWEFAQRAQASGVVVIVAVTRDHELLLVEQHRPPVGGRVLEWPAGLAGDTPQDQGEALETAARRELLEETGYGDGQWRQLTSGPPSAGLSNEIVTLFLAHDLVQLGPGGGDESEQITLHRIARDRAVAWLARYERYKTRWVDPKVYAGLYFVNTLLTE